MSTDSNFGHSISRLLLGRRLTDVERATSDAFENQQMILARKEQIASATKEFCRLPLTPVGAFAAGAAVGMTGSKPASVPLIMRIVSLVNLA